MLVNALALVNTEKRISTKYKMQDLYLSTIYLHITSSQNSPWVDDIVILYFIILLFIFTVNGDANFDMDSTSLTLAGFTQPAVARNLIESHSNYEKGLPQRFMWMFPKTTYAYLETLQPIDAVFTSALGIPKAFFVL